MTRSIVRGFVVTLAVLALGAVPAQAGSHEDESAAAEMPEGSGGKKAAPAEDGDGDAAADEAAEEKAPPKPRREGS